MWFFDEHYVADAEAVGRARRDLGDYARGVGLGPVGVGAVRLAVSEAVTNSVLHAYRGDPGAVRVAAAVLDDALTVAVSDGGVGVDAHSDASGLGCGLQVISGLADAMSLRPLAAGGTEVRMGFQLKRDQSATALAAAA